LNAGVALGVATLDAGGTVPLSQIPASIQGGVSYQGTWNASTNTPTLTSSVGSKGYYYVVSVAGSTNLNGITDWKIGDWAIYSGTAWQKIDNTDAVTSVNGYTGTVVLTNTDISGFGTMSTQNANSVSITGGSVTGITDLAIADGGTGQSTANAAFNALAPSQTGNAGKYLTTDGTDTSWATNPLGTVTSVAATVPSFLSISGSPITTSGTLAIGLSGTALPTANGGTGLTSFTANAVVYASSSSALATNSNFTFDGTGIDLAGNITTNGGGVVLNTTGGGFIANNTDNLNIQTSFITGNAIVFRDNAIGSYAEKMRITNTGISVTGTASVSGAVTLSGGTANGVAYLNGSKQITTGSALTFDGTNLGVGGTSGYETTNRTTIAAAGVNSALLGFKVGSSSAGYVFADASHLEFGAPTGRYFTWDINGEQMRLTSSGLEVKQSQLIGYSSYAGIGTNGLAVAGNMGIGTSSPTAKLNVAAANPTNGVLSLIQNTSISGQTGALMQLDVGNVGSSAIGIPGGTANALAFYVGGVTSASERMRLDSSGNLGLGVTPALWGSTFTAVQIKNAAYATSTGGQTWLGNNWYSSAGNIYISTGAASLYQQASGAHAWYNAPSGTAGNAITFTQAMTLDASGRLGIGETSPAYPIDINAGTNPAQINFNSSISSGTNFKIAQGIQGVSNGGMQIYDITNSAVRMAIDSSGNFLVGATAKVYDGKISVGFSSTGSQGIALIDNTAATGGIYAYFINSAGNVAGSISHSTTTGVLYNVTSDYRLKNIAGPVTNSGAFIDKLNPVQGSWKDDGSRFIGFLAHELQEASETVVSSGVKDGEEMQSIDYSNAELIANLVAEIQSLRKRLAAAGIA
jgi:hypothetical protein